MERAGNRRRRPRFWLCAGALAAGTALSACQDLKRAVGLEKSVPDASQVTQTPPLSIPPDFALRPPRPGEGPAVQTAAPVPVSPAYGQQVVAGNTTGANPYGAQPAYQQPPNPQPAGPYGAYAAYGAAPAAPAPGQSPVAGYAPTPSASYGTDTYFQNALRQYQAAQGTPQPAPGAYGASPYPAPPNAAPQPAYAPAYPSAPSAQPAYAPPPVYYPPAPAYPPQAYPPQAYPPSAYPPPAYPPQAYPPQAYPPQAYPGQPAYMAPGQPAYAAPGQPVYAGPAQPAQGLPPATSNAPAPVPPLPPNQAAAPAAEPSAACDRVEIDAFGNYDCAR